MRCLSCQHDLSKLTEHRCPECGRAFDPRNPRTFEGDLPKPSPGESLVWIIYLCIVLSGGALAIALLVVAFVLYVLPS